MADEQYDQYDKYSKMLELLENGAKLAAELAEKGANPIQMGDWTDQVRMCNTAIEYGNPGLTTRANALLKKLEQLKPQG